MKLLKYTHKRVWWTVDSTTVFADSSMTVDTTFTDYYSNLSLDFVPRIILNVNVLDGISVHITNELTKEVYNVPFDIEVLSNSTYRMYLLDSSFIKPESKYSIDVKASEEEIYKGKVLITTKDIQDYSYTTINNDKIYL